MFLFFVSVNILSSTIKSNVAKIDKDKKKKKALIFLDVTCAPPSTISI